MPKKLTILVVEDDPSVRFLLTSFLGRQHNVLSADDGEKGWQLVEAHARDIETPISIVFSDITMPKLDGLQLLQKIRDKYPDIGVIMISGTVNTRTAIEAMRKGAFDYIVKPFRELEELEVIIERWVRMQTLEARLSQYSALHQKMLQHLRLLTFLSVDVKGSAQMKMASDPFITQHSFQEYHRFIERHIYENNGRVHSTAGDGVMSCFQHSQEAVTAARNILNELAAFNRDNSSLSRPFQLRLGIHTGSAVVEEDGAVNTMFSESLDVAGHIQKNAAINRLELSLETVQTLNDPADFVPAEKTVVGFEVYCLRAAAE